MPPLALSHTWIAVTTGAPERKALEKAGFRIAPTVTARRSRDGVGYGRVPQRFSRAHLSGPDRADLARLTSRCREVPLEVSVAETGYSPIAIVFDRTSTTPEKLPFATWRFLPIGWRKVPSLR